jgi:hypothetical protein
MRFRLRTLLIVLALGPPVLASWLATLWWTPTLTLAITLIGVIQFLVMRAKWRGEQRSELDENGP